MKIRSDFVTNSSSSSFITIKVKSSRLQKKLWIEDEEELNQRLEDGAMAMKEEMEEFPLPFVEDSSSIIDYLLQFLGEDDIDDWDDDEWGGSSNSLTDASIQSVEIDHAEFDDGAFGPFEYVKINKKRKLTIKLEEELHDKNYKGEDISGMEFCLVGKSSEYQHHDDIVNYIVSNDGSIANSITDQTRYAVYANLDKNSATIKKARSSCIPLLSETAFAYRYFPDCQYEDVAALANEVGFNNKSFLSLFETYGLGKTKLEFWEGGKWVQRKAAEICCDWIKDKLFVLTGFDDKIEARYVEIITRSGGIVKSSTVLKTDYLIYNPEFDHETTKLKRAKELNGQGKNICIITDKAFDDALYNNTPPVS